MRKLLLSSTGIILCLVIGLSTLVAQSTIDPTGWTQTFNDDFNSLDISTNGSTAWKSQLPYGGQFGCPVSQSNISVSGGILTMKASFTGSDKCDSWGSWTGSLMCTVNDNDEGFTQQYGYFEVSAKMPTGGEGIWAAPLWLLTDNAREGFYNGTSYGEIDVNEYYGNQPGTYYTTLHQWNPHEGYGSTPNICSGQSCLSDDYHSYGVLVTPSVMTYYFDRTEVWSTPTTDVCKVPIYPLINLVVGAGWSTCNLPNDLYMYVDYMKVWALPNTGNPPTCSITSPADGATFTTGDNVTIDVSASDSDGSISKVEFYAGTNKIGTDDSSPYSFTWNNVANGSYTLMAVAYDNSGNITGSTPVDITAGFGTSAVRIRNRWQTDQYLYQDGSQVKYGTPSASDQSSQWTLTSTGDGHYYINNVATGNRMNIENALGYVECTSMWDGAWSAEWRFDNVGDGSGFQMIGIRWNTSEFINIESLLGYAQCNTPPGGGAYSAQWILEPVSGGGSTPAAPTGLSATAGDEQVSLSWTASSGATSYSVYRGTSADGESTTPIATGITTTSYTNTGLTNGTNYYYKVKATNSYGTSGYSNEASATPTSGGSAPDAPTGLTATGGDTQVALSWTASSGATSYSVYRGTSAGGESSTAIASGISTTSYTNTGLTNGTTYYYKVKATNANGTSGYSNEASATPAGSGSDPKVTGTIIGTDGGGNNTKDKAVDNITSTFFDAPTSQAWVGFDFGSGNAKVITKIRYYPREGYESRMYQGKFQGANNADFSDAVDFYELDGQPVPAYTEQTVSNGNSYRYVRYISRDGAYGNVAEIEFYGHGVGGSAPVAPTGLTASEGDAQVALSWTASSGATSYSVYRGTSAGGESTTAIASGITTTSYTNTGLTNGTTYFYKVKATNAYGTSGYSNEASATPTAGASSASIGLDFSGAGTPIPAGTLAGVIAQNNWNNVNVASGSLSTVKDNTGATVSGLSAEWGSNGSNTLYGFGSNFSGTNAVGNTDLYSSSLLTYGTAGTGWQGHITLTGIPYSSYDVYAYFEGSGNGYINFNGTPNGSTFTGGTTYSFSSANVTNFVAATGAGGAANYALLTDASGSNLTVYHQGGASGGLVGVQVVNTLSTRKALMSDVTIESVNNNNILNIAYLQDRSVSLSVDLSEDYVLKIFSLSGKEIKTINANEADVYILSKQELKEGMYIVNIISKDTVVSRKIALF